MKIRGHDIGLCSWSLRPRDAGELLGTLRDLGVEHLQLALSWLLDMEPADRQAAMARLKDSGVHLTAGMVCFPGEDYSTIAIIKKTGGYVPDEQWPARLQRSIDASKLGVELGLKAISTHIGFVPASSDAGYAVMVDRVGQVADRFAEAGQRLLMETGQEHAPELLQFLNDLGRKNVMANFDPANMILYGAGDPVEAIDVLGRHIGHVHLKDAVASSRPAVNWGEEVPFGTGHVAVDEFLTALDRVGYTGPLVIEREAGNDRVGDVRKAIETLRLS